MGLHDDNGILAAVPGEFIARACKLLPSPEAASEETMSAVIEAGHLGRVRMHYRRRRIRHHKASHMAWLVFRADPEPSP